MYFRIKFALFFRFFDSWYIIRMDELRRMRQYKCCHAGRNTSRPIICQDELTSDDNSKSWSRAKFQCKLNVSES